MLECHVLELQRSQIVEWQRVGRPALFGNPQDALEHIQGSLGLPISVDDVSELLQRAKDEERVDEQGEELSHRNPLRVNQVQHEEQNAGAKKIDARPLDEAETTQIPHLLELELQDLARRGVEPLD